MLGNLCLTIERQQNQKMNHKHWVFTGGSQNDANCPEAASHSPSCLKGQGEKRCSFLASSSSSDYNLSAFGELHIHFWTRLPWLFLVIVVAKWPRYLTCMCQVVGSIHNHSMEEMGRSCGKPLPHSLQVQWAIGNRRWRCSKSRRKTLPHLHSTFL